MTRLSRALNSSDLEHQEWDCDVDILQAAGLVGIHRNLGMMILEAKEGAAGDGAHAVARIKDLERALGPRVLRFARRWKVRVGVDTVAVQIAKELIVDRCLVCHGRGFIPMLYDDQNTRDVDCHSCFGSGTGKKDYEARARSAGWPQYTRQLAEWWEAVLQSCCDAEISARRHMWKKLRGLT